MQTTSERQATVSSIQLRPSRRSLDHPRRFLDPSYVGSYLITTLCAGVISFSIHFGFVGAIVALLVALPLLVAILMLVTLVFVGVLTSAFRRRWKQLFEHLAAVPLGAVAIYSGYLIGPTIAISWISPQIESAVRNHLGKTQFDDPDIEIISTNPDIAVYRTAYLPGFAAPGSTSYIVLDRSGRFSELAKQGRVRSLAESADIQLRNYHAYCFLRVKHWIGAYSFATSYDVDGCEPK